MLSLRRVGSRPSERLSRRNGERLVRRRKSLDHLREVRAKLVVVVMPAVPTPFPLPAPTPGRADVNAAQGRGTV